MKNFKMMLSDKLKLYNKIIVFLIVSESLIRQFIPIGGVALMGIFSIILLALIKKTYIKLSKPYFEPNAALASLFILCLLQFLNLFPQIRAVLCAWILFLVMYFFSNWNIAFFSSLKKGAYFITIIGLTSVLSLGGFSALSSSVREGMLIDKGILTIWFSITLCLSFTDFIVRRQKKLSGLIFLLTLIVNIIVVQSKTCIVAFGVFFLIILIFSEKSFKQKVMRFTFPIIVVYGLLCISNPSEYIPHTFIVAINQLWGSDIIPVYTDKFDMGTYDSRDLIDAFCASLFLENPIIGIGLGNYELIPVLPTGVTECENTYFDLLVNGGILYGGPVIVLLFLSLIRCIKRIRETNSKTELYYVLGILSSMIVCFRWNDFLNVNIFMFIGVCYYFSKDKSNLSKFC